MTNKRLAGKTALITGGTGGIGIAVAQCFIEEGAKVYITGRHAARLATAVQALGPGATGFAADVTRSADMERLRDQLQARAEGIDILFANAGAVSQAPLGAMSEAHLDLILGTNIKGLVLSVQTMLPLLRDGSSVILAGSSNTARGSPGLSAYSASKAAVRSFARSWMLELRSRGIRVNVLSPGPTRTPMLESMAPAGQAERMYVMLERGVPSGRLGTPQDIAHGAVFLASDESRWVNGSEFAIDGGVAQY
ncbi:SDR family oxidoreductase [Xylophilus sp. ASV27]|uniref:SDR family oxidoreductase n=1 Tax=Xylophilus sp. ASV27 TaxID=2795129 RepID=UPI0018EAF173|nr:SDR family oxidoreductase [Xylophilus sp. ASV27]